MEVEEVWAGECVVFISHNLVVAESAEAVLSGDVGVSTEFDVEAVVGASKTQCLWSEVVGAVWKDGWKRRNVSSLGLCDGGRRFSIHHLRYSLWRSFLRGVELGEMVVSEMLYG